jgi:hypothetical protein
LKITFSFFKRVDRNLSDIRKRVGAVHTTGRGKREERRRRKKREEEEETSEWKGKRT